jgi:hypothetical protein
MPELSYASLISFRYYLLYLNTFVLPLERVFEFIGEFPPKTSKPLNFYLLELELPLPHDLHARTFERVQRSRTDLCPTFLTANDWGGLMTWPVGSKSEGGIGVLETLNGVELSVTGAVWKSCQQVKA